MSKKKSHKANSLSAKRGANLTANRPRLLGLGGMHPYHPQNQLNQYRIKSLVQSYPPLDRRRFHPIKNRWLRPVYDIAKNRARMATRVHPALLYAEHYFKDPRRVMVCVRRRVRRQVLHAFRIAGSRGAARTQKHYNELSKVRC